MVRRYFTRAAGLILIAASISFNMSFVHKGSRSSVKDEPALAGSAIPSSTTTEGKARLADLSYKASFELHIRESYLKAGLDSSGLSLETYREAVTGYHNLMSKNPAVLGSPLITIVDLNQSSKNRRLWVIDLSENRVVFNAWVAHGQGSGGEYATSFSDTPNSNQSSLGFYLTQGTYMGSNGNSLKLEGLDAGFNSNAFDRYVVVHGAAYASEDFIKANGRLGRSQGCPALPLDLAQPIINKIKEQTVLYIDGPSGSYTSQYLDANQAALCFGTDQVKGNHVRV